MPDAHEPTGQGEREALAAAIDQHAAARMNDDNTELVCDCGHVLWRVGEGLVDGPVTGPGEVSVLAQRRHQADVIIAAGYSRTPRPVRCDTCEDSGLVDWAPGQQRDSEDDQQPCPDCTPRPVTVSEEAIEAAARAWQSGSATPSNWENMSERMRDMIRTRMRAALEAALPHLSASQSEADVRAGRVRLRGELGYQIRTAIALHHALRDDPEQRSASVDLQIEQATDAVMGIVGGDVQ